MNSHNSSSRNNSYMCQHPAAHASALHFIYFQNVVKVKVVFKGKISQRSRAEQWIPRGPSVLALIYERLTLFRAGVRRGPGSSRATSLPSAGAYLCLASTWLPATLLLESFSIKYLFASNPVRYCFFHRERPAPSRGAGGIRAIRWKTTRERRVDSTVNMCAFSIANPLPWNMTAAGTCFRIRHG